MAASTRTQAEVIEALSPELLRAGVLHRKTGRVFLRRGVAGERVVTRVDGVDETANTVPDDGAEHWIVCADTSSCERFVLPGAKRAALYRAKPLAVDHPRRAALAAEGFDGPFEPLGRVLALEVGAALLAELFPTGRFVAPWGEEMLVETGDMLATPADPAGGRPAVVTEVYRIARSAFEQTYVQES
jgi:hypothetical protein